MVWRTFPGPVSDTDISLSTPFPHTFRPPPIPAPFLLGPGQRSGPGHARVPAPAPGRADEHAERPQPGDQGRGRELHDGR